MGLLLTFVPGAMTFTTALPLRRRSGETLAAASMAAPLPATPVTMPLLLGYRFALLLTIPRALSDLALILWLTCTDSGSGRTWFAALR